MFGRKGKPVRMVCSICERPWEDHYQPELLKYKSGPFGTFGLREGDHAPHLPGIHAERTS